MTSSNTFKWGLFFVFSIISVGLTYHYFPQAYPIVHVDLTMNRIEAISDAHTFAQNMNLGPKNCSSAASFYTDEQVKTFVELEAGGTPQLISMMKEKLYIPFNWKIRLFKPFDQHELMVLFTPEGAPYGFKETISENEQRPFITQQEAQQKAEQFAAADPWGVSFASYNLIESSQETVPSERVDYTFVYERIDAKIGDGYYRLKIIVSGNEVSELQRSVKVPDVFVRKYMEMRSANSTIAYVAFLLMMILYLLGCSLFGLYMLLKQRWVLWRVPLKWASIIGLLSASTTLNELPLLWMEYNTALSPIGFIVQRCIGLFAYLIGFIAVLFIIFTAAESLTRKAFGNQPQLWKLFSPQAASSYTMLGFTLSGYLVTPILLTYTTLFYVFSTKWFGWWNPSFALFDPNILATYFPWLESIAHSLQAGFMEECLFRAIPLATAALIGKRYGNQRWWLIGAFILQAIIFGAAHANYPAQPAYARVVELLVISFIFGGIYLRAGLYPAIIAHFTYDVVWFALPLFVSSAPGAWFHQSMVVFCTAVPLFIIIFARYKRGSWNPLPSSLRNNAWHPPQSEEIAVKPNPKPQPFSFSSQLLSAIMAAGIIALCAYALAGRFTADTPSFTVSRTGAAHISQQQTKNKHLSNAWTQLTFPFKHFDQHPSSNKQHRFVWQTAGKELYNQLIGSYLVPSHWISRFVQFNGNIEQRAEEYIVSLYPDGTFMRLTHKLPESAPGKALSKDEATAKALSAINEQFQITPDQLNELSAIAQKQPNRLDWIVTYASKNQHGLTTGQPRISVTIAGDEIVDTDRFIQVPEEWERIEKNKELISLIISQLCRMLLYLVVIIGAVISLRHWNQILNRSFILLFFGLGTMFIFELLNSWPIITATFNTSQPYWDQLFRFFTFPAFVLLLRAAILAAMICLVTIIPRKYVVESWKHTLIIGSSLGVLFAGTQAFLQWIITPPDPLWPNVAPLGFLIPFTTGISSLVLHYLTISLVSLLSIISINWFSNYATQRKTITYLLLGIGGFTLSGMLYADAIWIFLAAGFAFSIIFIISYITILRYDSATIPVATATYMVLHSIQQALMNGYPHANVIVICAALLIIGMGLFWSHKMNTPF